MSLREFILRLAFPNNYSSERYIEICRRGGQT